MSHGFTSVNGFHDRSSLGSIEKNVTWNQTKKIMALGFVRNSDFHCSGPKHLTIGPEPWNSELQTNPIVCYIVTHSTSPSGKYWAPSPAIIQWKFLPYVKHFALHTFSQNPVEFMLSTLFSRACTVSQWRQLLGCSEASELLSKGPPAFKFTSWQIHPQGVHRACTSRASQGYSLVANPSHQLGHCGWRKKIVPLPWWCQN